MMLSFEGSDIEKLIKMDLQKQVRTVHGLEVETLDLHKVNGKDFSLPPYVEKD